LSKQENITFLNDAIDGSFEVLKWNYLNYGKDKQLFVPMWSGRVGCGKSQGVNKVKNLLADWMLDQGKIKDKSEYKLVYVDAPQYDAGEISGWFVPSKDGQSMTRLRPNHCPADGAGVIFIDEITQAPTSIQNILGQLILERRLGEHKLGKDWMIVCAGNRVKDRAGSNVMPTQVRDRLKPWYNVDNNIDSIVAHFSKKGVNSKIISWLKYQPRYVEESAFDRDANSNPTPRSCEIAGSVLDMELSDHLVFPTLAGTIGEEGAQALMSFLKYYDRLPNIDNIIKNPSTAEMVEKGTALAFVLTTELSKRANKSNFGNIADYMVRMYQENDTAELVASFVKECLARDGTLKTHPKMLELFGSNSPFKNLLN
tara:strand:+ start:1018 stop:2127 length:1110 start_codon:yes stop_codon:yes gene_type:complete